MFSKDAPVPELIPRLSRGKHRSPRKGACFMELASHLAGERWSDHPACTHPLLASLARLVNDHTSDAGRGRLAGLVPSVIGLTSDDPHVDVQIALRSATTALPIAAAERQRVLALSVLAAERILADLDGRPADRLEERSRWALAQVPDAAQWARRFTGGLRAPPKRFRRHAAPNIVRQSVLGIAQACVPDPDGILHDLLAGAIGDCAEWVPRDADPDATFDTPRPGLLRGVSADRETANGPPADMSAGPAVAAARPKGRESPKRPRLATETARTRPRIGCGFSVPSPCEPDSCAYNDKTDTPKAGFPNAAAPRPQRRHLLFVV